MYGLAQDRGAYREARLVSDNLLVGMARLGQYRVAVLSIVSRFVTF